jgi:hypothetical protein
MNVPLLFSIQENWVSWPVQYSEPAQLAATNGACTHRDGLFFHQFIK